MRMRYRARVIDGPAAMLVDELRMTAWNHPTKREYKREVRERTWNLHGRRIRIWPDRAFLRELHELGSIEILDERRERPL